MLLVRSRRRVTLTKPQREVARYYIIEGKKADEVGNIVYTSPRTVQHHARNIYRKLGVNNKISAALEIERLGIEL